MVTVLRGYYPGKRYGQWSGNPKGLPEDETKCVEEIIDTGGFLFKQCSRKRGHGPKGLYCKQHGKMREKYEERRKS